MTNRAVASPTETVVLDNPKADEGPWHLTGQTHDAMNQTLQRSPVRYSVPALRDGENRRREEKVIPWGRRNSMNTRRYARFRWRTATIVLAVMAGCVGSDLMLSHQGYAQSTTEQSTAQSKAVAGPSPKWNSARRDALTDALQVWRLGKDYFEETSEDYLSFDRDERVVFKGIDRKTRRFLDRPDLQPVVRFGCMGRNTPYEDALIETLTTDEPSLRLQALAILMRVRAPSSVPLQWKALGELRQLKDRPQWQPLLDEWQACFDSKRLEQTLRQVPPKERTYDTEVGEFLWSIRAAAVIQDVRAMDRLAVLSAAAHLYTSLAAERSLEDFSGPAANQALVRCLLGWRFDAYVRAGDALLERDKKLLAKALLETTAPKSCRYYQGVLLARCDQVAAVPILCEEVRAYNRIDMEMFAHIARLGTEEHRNAIESLPSRVRPEQRCWAERSVERFTQKLKHRAEQDSSEQAKAIVKLEDLGAEVIMDETRPGKVIIGIDLGDYSTVQDADLQYVAKFPELQSLNLYDTRVTDAGLLQLQGLAHLDSLILSGTRITDAGLAHLRPLNKLVLLNLSSTRIAGIGLESLKSLGNLESLNLSLTQITDAGLAHLRGLTKLTTLSLYDTDVNAAALAALKQMTSLRELNLRQTDFGKANADELRRVLPKCDVQY